MARCYIRTRFIFINIWESVSWCEWRGMYKPVGGGGRASSRQSRITYRLFVFIIENGKWQAHPTSSLFNALTSFSKFLLKFPSRNFILPLWTCSQSSRLCTNDSFSHVLMINSLLMMSTFLFYFTFFFCFF